MAGKQRKPKRPGSQPADGAGRTRQASGGSASGARYVQSCRRRALAVQNRREFGQLNAETLMYVACEHRLTTIRLGAVKSLEAGDSKRQLSALRAIERCEGAGQPVRVAARQAANVVQARLEAK
ncbi:MAG: hypothetical protein LLG08_06180 [Actinomycetia bacterium]|nr:hypothetical protein [Actinomycetes bacterium]